MDSKSSSSIISTNSAEGAKKVANHDLWNMLPDSVTETILARTNMFDFFQSLLVCQRWESIIRGPTFLIAALQVKARFPCWFLMIDSKNFIDTIYDMEMQDWRQGQYHIPSRSYNGKQSTAVASSGGLMCFATVAERKITVANPMTRRPCALIQFSINESVHAIGIHGTKTSYQVFVVLEKLSGALAMEIYSSKDKSWKTLLLQKQIIVDESEEDDESDIYHEQMMIPSKQYNGLTSIDSNGTLMVYYLNADHLLVKCDTKQCIAYEYPGFSIPYFDYCYDLVECGGRVYVVVLREVDVVMENGEYSDETHMVIHLSEFDEEKKNWKYVAAMPNHSNDIQRAKYIELSKKYDSSDDIDMTCCGFGNSIMLCLWSKEDNLYDVVTYNIVEDSWDFLPPCVDRRTGKTKKFVAAYPIIPDIGEKRDG